MVFYPIYPTTRQHQINQIKPPFMDGDHTWSDRCDHLQGIQRWDSFFEDDPSGDDPPGHLYEGVRYLFSPPSPHSFPRHVRPGRDALSGPSSVPVLREAAFLRTTATVSSHRLSGCQSFSSGRDVRLSATGSFRRPLALRLRCADAHLRSGRRLGLAELALGPSSVSGLGGAIP